MVCFYNGHAATEDSSTCALLNSSQRGCNAEGYKFNLKVSLNACAKEKGAYVISLLACGRKLLPEEEKRGGSEANVRKPIEETGQSITIHGV